MSLNKKQLAHIAAIEKSLKALKLGSKSEKSEKSEKPAKAAKLTKKVEESIINCSTKKELGKFELDQLEAFAKEHKIKLSKKITKALITTAVLKYIKENYESDSDDSSDSDESSDSDSCDSDSD